MSMRTACLAGAAAMILSAAAACSSSGSGSGGPTPLASNTTASVAPVKAGGSLTVLEGQGVAGDWPYGLDPATNTDGAADQDYMNAVYGQLFELGANGKIIYDLATGATISPDGKTVTIKLRQGVQFSDGNPFNAEAVAWNFDRDLKSLCTCSPQWPVDRVHPKIANSPVKPGVITTPDAYTVVVKLNQPDGAFINQMFDATPNWIASPKAVSKMGLKQFAQYPVGAGPF